MIQVVIVDDHKLFADGLGVALGALPDIRVVATFQDGSDFIAEGRHQEYDVLLLDLEMPIESGFEVLAHLRGEPPTIVVSMHVENDQIDTAHELGARGYLSKSAPLTDVAAAIRAVHDGCDLIGGTTTLSDLPERYRQAALDPGAASLTQREREILAKMATGITGTSELADVLYISQKTVKNHLASIYHKLAISDRAQAAVEAIRLGLGPE